MGVGGHYHAPAAFLSGRLPGIASYREQCGPRGPSGRVWKISSPPRTARSQSLSRLLLYPLTTSNVCFCTLIWVPCGKLNRNG